MQKLFLLIFIALSLHSCNLKEQIEKMNRINSNLETEFEHDNIDSTYHFGTEENDNYFQISFYEFDLTDKTHSELELLANRVQSYFVKKFPEFENLEFIEVRFSKSSEETADSFINFKFE